MIYIVHQWLYDQLQPIQCVFSLLTSYVLLVVVVVCVTDMDVQKNFIIINSFYFLIAKLHNNKQQYSTGKGIKEKRKKSCRVNSLYVLFIHFIHENFKKKFTLVMRTFAKMIKGFIIQYCFCPEVQTS